MTSPLQRTGANSGILTTQGSDSHFDFSPGVGQQSLTFTFTLVDAATNMVLGSLHPIADSPPQLSHDTTRTIVRQLSGLALGVADTAAIDTIKDRILLAVVTPDGTSYPLGRYMFSDNTRARYTSGLFSAPTLMDESFIIDQETQAAFPTATPTTAGAVYSPPAIACQFLAEQFMSRFAAIDLIAAPSPYSTTNGWAFGTAGMQVMTDLAKFGDYFSPWMGNDTNIHLIRTFDPAAAIPDFDWDRYYHVLADTISETDDLLTAPNRFIVVGNNPATVASQGPIVGSYDVPQNAPHSIKNRGFVVPSIQQMQLETQAQAQAVAVSQGIQNTLYQRTTLSTFIDPRHDSYNVIRWQGVNWLEIAWAMTLSVDGGMTHTLRKTYS